MPLHNHDTACPSALRAGVEWITCLDSLLWVLDLFPCSAPPGLHRALCGDAELVSRFAQLTARLHAALVAAPNWADAAWAERHARLSLWVFEGAGFDVTPAHQQAALLPLLVAAGSMLKGEVSLLASLPALPPEGSDAKQARQLTNCWLPAIFMVGRCIKFQCSAATQELSGNHSPARLRSLLLPAAARAQHVLRFVSEAEAGGPAAEGIVRALKIPESVGTMFNLWAEGCADVCGNCRSFGPAGSSGQQHEVASTVGGLLGTLLQLLGRLPRLAEACGKPLDTHLILKASEQASALLAHGSGHCCAVLEHAWVA